MIFLRSVSLKDKWRVPSQFPFSIPVVKNLKELEFTTPVTFFIGENGSGKSTLLEAIAAGFGSIAIGSQDFQSDESLEHARLLAGQLKFVRNLKPERGFFFRVEDFFGFTKRIIRQGEELDELETEYNQKFTGYGRKLAMGMAQSQRKALDTNYGENPDAFSHGENLLNLLNSRLVPRGFYLLDEPETPLSALRQLTLIHILKDMVDKECQFIIATHSPILMAFPDATILSFDDSKIKQMDYDKIEHVTITRAFLNDPESFLRRL
ncbi:MAG: AAA family ATPase [Candidatus Hatepunaea meridiana]|nr:AAA family ATPase [Candidatus Hatepunaea meridiana]